MAGRAARGSAAVLNGVVFALAVAWIAGVEGLRTILEALVLVTAALTLWVHLGSDPEALRRPVNRRTVLAALSVPILIVAIAVLAWVVRS